MESILIGLAWIVSIVASFVGGSYLPAYFKKKGENLATHEDIQMLVEQIKATTEATKAIEARIDDQVWNKQRQWEIKRDALFEGCRAIANFDAAISRLNATFSAEVKETDEDGYKRSILGFQNDALRALTDALYSFERTQLLISIVSGEEEVRKALGTLDSLLKKTSAFIVNGDRSSYASLAPLIKNDPTVAPLP
jgi:hypothetical protein